jgi:hypothetical protein
MILPPRLKADSDGTEVAGTARKSFAMIDRVGNLLLFAFHQSSGL